MSTSLLTPAASPAPAPAARPGRRARLPGDRVLFRAGTAVVALHALDDRFLQPPPGTAATDHLVSGLVPLALLALAAWIHPRLRGSRRGALALLVALAGVTGGVEAFYYTREVGPSGDDFTGLASLAAGLGLAGLGAVTLWRTRRRHGSLARRVLRRAAVGIPAALVVLVLGWPLALGYVFTHVGRAVVPANELGVPSERVTFETADGLRLQGWYIPSRNGAAVIAFPGRKGPQKPARMLARHGYGVLLFDRRGEGVSEGSPNALGWGGARDIDAAVRFLQRRPDVDPDRIGGLGLSVGGELMLEAAARNSALKAVVSEGAGARSVREDRDIPGIDPLTVAAVGVNTAAVALSADRLPPDHLKDLVPEISPRPILLIHAGIDTEVLNPIYHRAAQEPKELWEIPEASHTGGLTARPAEYERRVVGFFDRALRP